MASVTLGSTYAPNTSDGISYKLEATSTTDSTKGYITAVLYIKRERSGWWLDGTANFKYTFGTDTISRQVKRDGSSDTVGTWVEWDRYTYSFTLDPLSSKTLSVGFLSEAVTSSVVGFDVDLGSKNITVGPYATTVGVPTINITDEGNSFSISVTKGKNGTNNTATGVSTIEYSLNSENYDLTYNSGEVISITENATVYVRVKTLGTYGKSEYGYASKELVYTPPYVKIYTKYNGEYALGTLYARKSTSEQFKPATHFYHRFSTNEDFFRYK